MSSNNADTQVYFDLHQDVVVINHCKLVVKSTLRNILGGLGLPTSSSVKPVYVCHDDAELNIHISLFRTKHQTLLQAELVVYRMSRA